MNEVPDSLGELSRYELQQAIEAVDRELKDAPQELRNAVSIIKLIANVPRRSPWYGVPVDDEDNSVTAGVLLRNALEVYEAAGRKQEAARLRKRIEIGKRQYHEYLDHLLDPEQYERDEAERRLKANEAEYLAHLLHRKPPTLKSTSARDS